MAFSPATLLTKCHPRDGSPLRYRVRTDAKGTTRLHVSCLTELAGQVKGRPTHWRLDLDTVAGMGRLTGLLQPDGDPATQKPGDAQGRRFRFEWALTPELLALFPEADRMQPLPVKEVTSMGIEFHLPETPATA
jgi:hypothetical protein